MDSTPFGTKTTNGKMSPIDSVPVGGKTPDPTTRTRPMGSPKLPTDLPEQNGKSYVPGDTYLDPSSSDSSWNKSNFSNDSNSSKSIEQKKDKKKKRQKHKKQDASDSSQRNPDSPDNSEYRCKQRKKKSPQEKDPINYGHS